jgi:adenylate cyclase, class 2
LATSPGFLGIVDAALRAKLMPRTDKTNREIEIKLRVTDIRATIHRLNAIGATSKGRVFEQNALYDTPQSDLRRRGRLLRIRIETPAIRGQRIASASQRIVMTAKGPSAEPAAAGTGKKSRYKERAERELVVTGSTPRSCDAALRTLGFKPKFRYEKFRTSFRLGALHLDLDETPAGDFLELEGKPKSIDRVAKALGYRPSAYFLGTYWDVYVADCRRKGLRPGNMAFHRK